MSKWQPATFLCATTKGPVQARGYTYASLGLHYRAPKWVVTHLGTGHSICRIALARFAAEEIATEIAECGDWDWSGLTGFRNKDPDIKQKVRAILDRVAPVVSFTTKDHPELVSSEQAAREIAEANA